MSRVSGCFWVYGFQFRGFGGLGFACRPVIKARAEESFFGVGFLSLGFLGSGFLGLGV